MYAWKIWNMCHKCKICHISTAVLQGGLACPALLPVNSDGPSNKTVLLLFAFLVFLWHFAQKTGSQIMAEIFYFCFSWADWLTKSDPYSLATSDVELDVQLIVIFALLYLLSMFWLYPVNWAICFFLIKLQWKLSTFGLVSFIN